jgi:hypothetical protein
MTRKISALLVATLLLAAASTARATVVLSDNLGGFPLFSEDASDTQWLTASFGTDGAPYDLTSVVMKVSGGSGSDAVVEIYTSVGAGIGTPGVLVGTLATPPSPWPDEVTFTASGITLSPFSTYWVVLRSKTATTKFHWRWTEGYGLGVGFQHTWGYSTDSGATWTTYSEGPFMMKVTAEPLTPWADMGSALPGVAGAPQMWGTGTLLPDTAGALHLASAAPSASAVLFLSFSSTPTPFKGGTLLPVPVALAWPAPTDALGESLLAWTAWPTGLSGNSLIVQIAIADSAAIHGVALSNALAAIVP